MCIGIKREDSSSKTSRIVFLQMIGVSTYYPPPSGDAEFVKLSSELVFGEKEIPARVMGVQTGEYRHVIRLGFTQPRENHDLP